MERIETVRRQITLLDHPIVHHNMAILRDTQTCPAVFREHLREVAVLLAVEALRDAETVETTIQTPLAPCTCRRLARPIALIPILRAGLGLAEGMMQILPDALVGHIGLARNEQTLLPEQYYCKLPTGLAQAEVLLVDPMLATGNSAVAAVGILKKQGAMRIRYTGLVGAPEGVETLRAAHPDVPIFLAALDAGLNKHGYILPGLGDAGDRYFSTFST
jgi:uracil phosphoribosyltransferase